MLVLKNVSLFYSLTQECSTFYPSWVNFLEKFIAGCNRRRNHSNDFFVFTLILMCYFRITVIFLITEIRITILVKDQKWLSV